MELVTNKTLEKLKYDLVRDGLVSYEDIEKAHELAVSQNVNIGQILIKSNLITEEVLLKFLENKLHIPYVDLKDYTLDTRCLSYISFNDAQKYKIIPLFKIENVLTVAMADQTIMVAKGGRGGRGNACFATSQKRAPQFCEPGENGIERTLELELKLIADVGLLGMPNAGKSTLISSISSAKPKIANYPFTTLVPNLGVVKKDTGDGYVVADIPGLIEGASEGIGLGHEFLRHVERCRFLIHIVDLTQEDPINNYKVINEELKKHSEQLSKVYQVIALNKIDTVDEEMRTHYLEEFKKFSDDVFLISAATRENLKEFMHFVSRKVDEIPKPIIEVEVEEDDGALDNDDSAYSVYKVDKHTFVIEGGKIFRLANVTDGRNTEQLYRFQNILKAMGVFDALKAAGVQEGDLVKIGHLEFDYLY